MGGAAVRALACHQGDLGLIPGPGIICELSLLFLTLCFEGFSLGTLVFLPPQKSTSKFQFDPVLSLRLEPCSVVIDPSCVSTAKASRFFLE